MVLEEIYRWSLDKHLNNLHSNITQFQSPLLTSDCYNERDDDGDDKGDDYGFGFGDSYHTYT